MFHRVSLQNSKTKITIVILNGLNYYVCITIGLERSPRMNHKSTIVINPINVTWNNPTNLTLTQQDMVTPENINQNHHVTLNSLNWHIRKQNKHS